MSEPNNNEHQAAEISNQTNPEDNDSAATKQPKLLGKNSLLIMMIILLIGNILYWSRGVFTNHNAVSAASDGQGATNSSARILPVETMEIEPVSSYPVSRVYTGEVTARRTSELGFDRVGKLTEILVQEGDYVQKNQALAYLGTGNLQNTWQQLTFQKEGEVAKLQEMKAGPRTQTIGAARAAVKDLTEQLELSRTKNIRRRNLYQEGAINREQLDESSSEVGVLQARLESEENRLDELSSGTRIERIAAQKALIKGLDSRIAEINLNISKSVLKAPFNSRISVRRVDEGTVISPGEPILRLVEMENLEVRIGLPTTLAYRLPQGSQQKLTIAGQTYQATVKSILPEVDSATRTVTVVLQLDTTPQAQVAVGQIARLELTETIRESGYWLPVTALTKSVRGLWSCYVLEQQSGQTNTAVANQVFTVKQEDVEVLYTKGDQMLVRGTLTPDDLVILNGSHRFVPGQLVRQSKSVMSNE